MALFRVGNVSLRGVASCVPRTIEENANLSLFKEDEAEKFCLSTGVYRRRIADDKTTTADLCYFAAERLIKDLKWDKESIECLVFVTQTPDYILPATSCILQNRLGLNTNTYAIDLSLGCSGWIYGMTTIAQTLSSTGLRRGLLLVGDTISKFSSDEDKSSYPLFGDAGTATAFEFNEGTDITFHTGTDGSGYEAIIIPDGGYRNPYSSNSLNRIHVGEGISRSRVELELNGMDVFSFGISRAPQSVNSLLDFVEVDREKVDYFLFHQANLFMNEKIRKKLKLNPEQIPYSLTDFGNTSSASIPLTMTTQLSQQLREKPLRLIACGFGVGLSWGSAYFETSGIVCPELIEI